MTASVCAKRAIWATFLLLPLLLGACGRGPARDGGELAGDVDSPARVITLAPNITEIAFALERGDRVVARGMFDDYPPEVLDLPAAGGYLDPDLERLTVLAPDMLIVSGQNPKVSEFAAMQDIPILNVELDSFATIESGIRKIGEALHAPGSADLLAARFRKELNTIGEAVTGWAPQKVLIITGRREHNLNSLFTVGGGSFVSELVQLAGGENIYRDADTPYLEGSKEKVVLDAPEAIIEFHCGESLTPEEKARYIEDWQELPSLPAAKRGRVLLIQDTHGLRPGIRLPEIGRQIAEFLHPGVVWPE